MSKTFTVTAEGETYPVRTELRDWGFEWYPDQRAWQKRATTAGEVSLFEAKCHSADWEGVMLSVQEEP